MAWLRSSLRYFLDSAWNLLADTLLRAPRAWPARLAAFRLLLAADREHLDALQRSRPAASAGRLGVLSSTSRSCCRQVGGLARDRRRAPRRRGSAMRERAGPRRSSGTARAGLGLALARLDRRRRRAARHQRTGSGAAVVVADRILLRRLSPAASTATSPVADLQAALELAADDLRPDEVGLDARLQRLDADARLPRSSW